MKVSDLFERQDLFRDIEKSNFPKTLYHGTSTELELSVGDYLLPPNHTNKLSEEGRKKNLDLIFLTPDFNYAKIYSGRSANKFGGEPIVYEVKPVGLEFYRNELGNNIYVADGGYIVDEFVLHEPA